MKKKKNKLSKIIMLILAVFVMAAVIFLAAELIIELNAGHISGEISIDEAQALVDKTVSELPSVTASGAKYIRDNISVKVEAVSYGVEKNAIFTCSYSTLDVGAVLIGELDNILAQTYTYYSGKTQNGEKVNATAIQIEFKDRVHDLIKKAESVSGEIEITAYQLDDNSFEVYCSDETVDTLYGGLITVREKLRSINSVKIDDATIDITNKNTLRSGIDNIIAFVNYSSNVPQTRGWLIRAALSFADEFRRNFIDKNMWKYLWDGLVTTLELTGCALLIGILLGILVAVVRVTNEKTGGLPILNRISKIYLSVIRGTPVMVQMLIIYFVILSPLNVNKFLSAVICFGINSGAYVSEIIRGGIMSVDQGQSEAGRSLGLSYTQTMVHIVILQAFKIVLPSLANEFIALLKETSVAFYIGIADLTQAGLRIRSVTYSNFMPLIAVAVIYLILVIILTKLVGMLEKKFKQSERQGGHSRAINKRK